MPTLDDRYIDAQVSQIRHLKEEINSVVERLKAEEHGTFTIITIMMLAYDLNLLEARRIVETNENFYRP